MIKEIQKIKIALTSNCTLRCSHCRINKEKIIDIKLSDCFKAVDFILNSNGDYKRIELYGGEPFTRFDLLKKVVDYIKLKKGNKKVSINIATNATLINDEIINWIRDNNIIIAISFSGSYHSHSHNRRFRSGDSSYYIVEKNIKRILESIDFNRIVCIYCIDPFFTNNIFSDFKKIIELGIKIVDIECVSGISWSKKSYKELISGIMYINDYITKLIKKNIYVFHEVFIEYDRNSGINFPNCLAYQDLEIYPDGGVGFYPYGFIDYKRDKKHIVIGNMSQGIKRRYSNCVYPSKLCDTCHKDYYVLSGFYDGSMAYNIRNIMIKSFYMRLKSLNNGFTKKYFDKLKEIMEVFYE